MKHQPAGDPYVQQPGPQGFGGGYPPPHGYLPPGYPNPYGYGPPPHPYGAQYLGAVSKPTGWFIVNWLFFWPLAIYSLVSAWQNIDAALFRGDVAGAQYQADRVRKFGIIALCIGIGWMVLMIIFFVAVGATVSSCVGSYSC